MAIRGNITTYLQTIKLELISDYLRVAPSPNYKRTHALAKGWEVHVNSDTEGFLTNDVEYAQYVQGPRRAGGREVGERQARKLRQKGWRSISDIARQDIKIFEQLVNRSIQPRAGSEGEID